ncbi:hypothetical protein BUALT_Bualt02G0106500 [Buddleja alternifolia]|uniref:Uncharacterized protein n=1 Tax=Buddleja alternifolia TaxID=168488 RepID=A0AAV6Y9U4_9LAMI|nr:hypothetical protein BUALT_Bualt02G0106500 [Buddleja alternifolia]
MSSSHPYMNTTSNPSFDEQRWIIHIRRSLEEDHDQVSDIAVSIFDIPKTLMLISPESYVPQLVALGPYHYSTPKPYEMERKMLEFRQGSDDLLYSMLMGFCKEILPFTMIQENPSVHQGMGFAPLLDFLYHLIVPKLEGSSEITSEEKEEKTKQGNENCDLNKPPLMEEIAIPSVTELSSAGIKFSVTNSGIFGINFDEKMATFYLPTIILNANTEVATRNLVAYEACNASGPLIFNRYTELMNGIIDSEDDAKLLREQGFILNHYKSDQDVANLWNGMSKSIRLTKVLLLDKVIEDVNNYYNGSWKVRIGKFMARNVFGSWQSLTLMAAILLLFFIYN